MLKSWEYVSMLCCLLYWDEKKQPFVDVLGDLKNFAIFTGKHLCWSEAPT